MTVSIIDGVGGTKLSGKYRDNSQSRETVYRITIWNTPDNSCCDRYCVEVNLSWFFYDSFVYIGISVLIGRGWVILKGLFPPHASVICRNLSHLNKFGAR